MSQLDLLRKRVEHNSVHNLKIRSFDRMLEKFYNAETFYLVNKLDTPLKGIIQTKHLADENGDILRISDEKTFSCPLELGIDAGDIIYWERTKSNWLIFLRRNTEKDYFLGEMREANYLIKWIDKTTHKKYSQLGSFRRDGGELKTIRFLDYLSDKANLFLPKNEKTESLKIYNKFFIDDEVWEVDFIDKTSHPRLINFSLKLSQRNKDDDDENYPGGKIEKDIKIISSLDNIKTIRTQEEIILNLQTFVDEALYKDTYEIFINDSKQFSDKTLSFSEIGTYQVKIRSLLTDFIKEYNIIVSNETQKINEYCIIGNIFTKATLSYTYTLQTDKETNGKWVTNSKNVKIQRQSGEECLLMMGKDSETFKLSYMIDNIEKASLEIETKNLFDY